MNILFLTNDELGSMDSNGIFTDLLRVFSDNGHSVYAVCANERKHRKDTELQQDRNINVLRVKTGNVTQVNMIEKGISTLLVEHQFKNAIKRHLKDVKFDLIMYSTPPITLAEVVDYVKKRDNAKTYLMLKDIFPQNAVDIKLMKKDGLLYKYFRKVEKRFYKISDFIGCMSQGNIDFLLKYNPEILPVKVEICPNTIEPLTIEKNKEKIIAVRKKYNVPTDKTVFIYGGNIGKPQGVEYIVECIDSNRNDNAFFLIVGSGTEFNKLKSYFDSSKPNNAKLLTKLPKNDYEVLANSCDVGLIFLDKRFTIPNFPSRILSYMQASMPVLAATDINTDIGEVIENGKFGYWCESSGTEKFNMLVDKLCDGEAREALGKNARSYLENHYTAKHSYEIIMKHFNKEEMR